ncbi:MAG: RND transporter, partial [Burkholderiales bacterium]
MRNNPLAGFATKAGKTMAACLLALALAGCMVGPDFVKPPVDYGAGYKATGWELADPSMASRSKGSWWDIYQDTLLDDLMRRFDVDNLNIAQAEAKYRQAIALLASATAPLMPTVTASGNANRSGGSATSAAGV